MLWSDIQAACEEADFLYEETGSITPLFRLQHDDGY
jgi:hypothetical protein